MMGGKVTILDYGVGNIYSVQRALQVCGSGDVCISNDPEVIKGSDHLILPGVGAFPVGIRALRDSGLDQAIQEFASSGRPLLGICLGMQMFATISEEFGENLGLDLIPGVVDSIPSKSPDGLDLKIPFIGWSNLDVPLDGGWEGTILKSLGKRKSVYLVHSFRFTPRSHTNLLASYKYGGHIIAAAVIKDNVIGLQFHPEKSGLAGLGILSDFLKS